MQQEVMKPQFEQDFDLKAIVFRRQQEWPWPKPPVGSVAEDDQ